MEFLTVENLTFYYPESSKAALSEIDLSIKKGEFVVICGKSGCGKSTLLRHMKPVLAPHGKKSGCVYLNGTDVTRLDLRTQASKIGYVLQNPDHQIVTDKVWHELAFGLESLGENQKSIRLKTAETASFFGIHTWFHENTASLSGGQKQLLNLASIMAMQPELLILDEPTAQLDPITASEFLENVKKINRELGVTVILTEHRLEEVLPAADQVIVMRDGKIYSRGTPEEVGTDLKTKQDDFFLCMPAPMRIYAHADGTGNCPVTVKEGRSWLAEHFSASEEIPCGEKAVARTGKEILVCKDVWFRYERDGRDIVKDFQLRLREGTFTAIVGGNGTGKSTALSLISGLKKPYRGKVLFRGKPVHKYAAAELFRENLAVLPQNPQCLFVKKTLRLDLAEVLSDEKISKEEADKRVREMAEKLELTQYLERHPYDLSGGEQQRAALAKVLLLRPKVLLMDEPTKGLDGFFKEKLASIFRQLLKEGVTLLMVSHDVEFCAKYADECGLFFDGKVITLDESGKFFRGNNFYTTAANRMCREVFPNAVTCEEVISLCARNKKTTAQ